MMKRRLSNSGVGIALVMLVALLSGCTSNRLDLVDSGALRLEKRPSAKIYIPWSEAYEDQEGFVVTGVLRRRDPVGLPIKAHVDVTIVTPDGTTLGEASSSDIYIVLQNLLLF